MYYSTWVMKVLKLRILKVLPLFLKDNKSRKEKLCLYVWKNLQKSSYNATTWHITCHSTTCICKRPEIVSQIQFFFQTVYPHPYSEYEIWKIRWGLKNYLSFMTKWTLLSASYKISIGWIMYVLHVDHTAVKWNKFPYFVSNQEDKY